jgi:F0F1-type ATP synthase membrane subunit c/vacuolar-type H+-ATPase subunit K
MITITLIVAVAMLCTSTGFGLGLLFSAYVFAMASDNTTMPAAARRATQ